MSVQQNKNTQNSHLPFKDKVKTTSSITIPFELVFLNNLQVVHMSILTSVSCVLDDMTTCTGTAHENDL